MKHRLITALTALVCSSACSSPETARTRGDGPGADLGNRDPIVRMHEGSKPYAGTPRLIPTPPPPLDPADQADRLSRR
jgi:hypothetical protein